MKDRQSGKIGELNDFIEEAKVEASSKKNTFIGEEKTKDKANKKGIIIPYPEVGVENGHVGIYVNNKETKGMVFKPLGRQIKLLSINTVLETGEIIYEIEFETLNRKVTMNLKRSELNKKKIQILAAYGADVFDHNDTVMIKHLLNQENESTTSMIHQELGWDKVNGQDIFKHENAVGISSSYRGELYINKNGTLEEWKRMIEDEVKGNTYLEAMIPIGLSALVIGYIGKEISLDSLFIHIVGNSTQGKTTAGQLAISTTGYPDTKENGLMGTWSGTVNALIGTLRGNNGLPVLLDESSVSSIKDFSSMIYTLAQGREKRRMDKEGELKEAKTWQTTIISTGENSLTSKSNQNIGVRMRISEFSNIPWTKNASNAKNIKEGVLRNYGHLAPLLAKKMIKLGKKKIVEMFKVWEGRCLSNMDDSDHFAPRIATKLGVIMTSAELIEEELKLGLDTEAIMEFIINNEKNMEERNLYKKAYEHLLEQVEIHKNKFIIKNKETKYELPQASYELWGKIEYKKTNGKTNEEKIIIIVPSKFNEIMNSGNFSDPKIVLRKWKEDGLLDCEKDRLTRNRKLDDTGNSINVYAIRVMEDSEGKESAKEDEKCR
ncbi:hypothetical protein CIW83_18180 [Tissierella sp. P1]|uniref:DUF927 domain-containing protein n=1 Tax=Tissierella sp. P1 TaxID=1280483 RepID=UPI000B9FD4C0|nr:DUF927 domain-containing protein [Tissierella sp. P1]OZV10852.1 hypothetical protein CIW83_18180 [Tissierella sp. P1]